ncbi:minichromosome maintenance protein MCM [Natronosalvus halobius]|uniref:minichromosome maintenance protein MCM n=1 Tax=Natronosalvus halobius TaxID=2953746 RepID=UPI00209EDE50|nr:minichromosome maintenance protein MCM [Natronosalvus halobius]USZ73740.1 minichromosome maintenance protein MCM [Natronosalvus halobius]
MSAQQIPEVMESCEEFLKKYYKEEVLRLANRFPNDQKSLVIDWNDLFKYDPRLADDYLDQPKIVLRHLKEALRTYDLPADIDLSAANVRIENLEDARTVHINEYRPEQIGQALGIRGQVTQLSEPKPQIDEAAFECTLCGTLHRIPQSGGDEMQEPHECQGCERQGPFQLNTEQTVFQQYQVARLEMPPERSNTGQAHIDVRMYDDLAGKSLEGNERLTANGILSIDDDDLESRTFDYHLETEGGSFEIEDGGFEDIDYEEHMDDIRAIAESGDPIGMLVDSLAPQLSRDERLEQIMTAMVLQLVGAGRKDLEDGPTFRGDFHVLILSDPGMGKSELLGEVEDISPIGRYVSGKGLSKAGATAAAVKDDFGGSEYTLKAGILVLANDGIACIDEIDKVQPNAVQAMHGALERQRVDVMKAGISSKLPAKTSLLAAGNPKYGRFDRHQPISEQIDLAPSLMSRFDLMFMMSDTPDEERDREVAEHIVQSWDEAARSAYRGEGDGTIVEREIPTEVLRAYIAYAKETVKPVFANADIWNRFIDHYVKIRSKGVDEDSPVPVTARKLQAFLRLAEASARARLSDTIEHEDVTRSIELIMRSLNDVGIDPESGEFDADIVEAGTSKSQRDRVKGVKACILDVEEEYDRGAPIDVVLERCNSIGIDTDKAESEIEKLKQKGELYEPSEGVFLTT